jgi:hypothetical protein
MAVTLTINVGNIESALASYDVIKIKRSTTGINGTYSDITAVTPQAATLTAPTAGNYDVVAKTLQFIIDQEAQVDHTFTGVVGTPLTAAQVASQLNAAFGDTVAYDDSGTLRFTSATTGTASRVEIVGGGAVTDFGWTDGDRDIGEAAHVQLVAGQSLYSFTDHDGTSSYYYKAQFLNTTNSLTSAESSAFQGDAGTVVGSDKLSMTKVDLIDGRGIALADQEITFYGVDQQLQVEGFKLTLTRQPITITTDSSGHAEVPLVRGSTWKVIFEGTSFIREFTVPDAVDFDLLSLLGAAPDPFRIVELQFPAAIRRTL